MRVGHKDQNQRIEELPVLSLQDLPAQFASCIPNTLYVRRGATLSKRDLIK